MRIFKWVAAGTGITSAAYAAYVASTWVRFGRPKPARGAARDALLDELMPPYEICERHSVRVAAPADVTLAAAKELDLESSRIIGAIFKARELILRSAPEETTTRPRGLLEQMKAIGWGVLAENPHEIVMGAVTRPWDANPVFRPVAPADFAAFSEPDLVKIVWTLRADPQDDGGSVFRTETRAVATDPDARGKFRWYWSFLSPGIIVIREAMMRPVADAADRAWRLEGDDVLPDAGAQLTHAITIDAPPADVWPWLVQMGGQRAGWYSWDRLDNAGKRSADRIIPELQHLAVGDVLPWRPVGTEGFEVLRIVPGRALVLKGGGPQFDGTWAFVVEPLGATRTRLVVRYRAAFRPGAHAELRKPMMAAVHAFMERKQLRTIKHHAEHMHPGTEAS
jgi:hypothetical protein